MIFKAKAKSREKLFAIEQERAPTITVAIVRRALTNRKRHKAKRQRNYTKNEAKKRKNDNLKKTNREQSTIAICYRNNGSMNDFAFLGAPIIISPTVEELKVRNAFINYSNTLTYSRRK